MIWNIEGPTGAGKTAALVELMIIPALRRGRKIVTNVKLVLDALELQVGTIPADQVVYELDRVILRRFWEMAGQGTLYIIDEAAEIFGHKSFTRSAEDRADEAALTAYLGQQRHYHDDVVFICHNYTMLLKALRDLVGKRWIVTNSTQCNWVEKDSEIGKRFGGITEGLPTPYQVFRVRQEVSDAEGKWKLVRRFSVKPKSHLFECYVSRSNPDIEGKDFVEGRYFGGESEDDGVRWGAFWLWVGTRGVMALFIVYGFYFLAMTSLRGFQTLISDEKQEHGNSQVAVVGVGGVPGGRNSLASSGADMQGSGGLVPTLSETVPRYSGAVSYVSSKACVVGGRRFRVGESVVSGWQLVACGRSRVVFVRYSGEGRELRRINFRVGDTCELY